MLKIMTPEKITQEMERLYNAGLSLEEVGSRFGMTRQGVRHRFVKAGIACRQPKIIDKDRLETLYSKDRLPIAKIAGILSVSKSKIKQTLETYGIPRRESIKKGGFRVDFLRSLEIGEKRVIKWRDEDQYAHLHWTAKLVGIKISIKSIGKGKFEVTRLE